MKCGRTIEVRGLALRQVNIKSKLRKRYEGVGTFTLDRKFYCDVKVVDEIMGAGKSTAAINYINMLDSDIKVIYVTPYLSEVDRIKELCKNRNFKSPNWKKGRKIIDLKELIKGGENVVTTHALFHNFDDELIDMCWNMNYILFLDEVTEVIEPHEGLKSKNDLDLFLNNYGYVDSSTGIVKWKKGVEYTGNKFASEKIHCRNGSLAYYGGGIMMWLFPIKVFNAFREVFILTYMFSCQLQAYYYDYLGVPYRRIYLTGDDYKNITFTGDESERCVVKKDYSQLINIIEDNRLNRIGDKDTALSKSWYERNKNTGGLDILRDNLTNYFINITGKGVSHNLWTTFSDYRPYLKGKGYTKGFESLNARATNRWRECDCVAYTVNRYLNPLIAQFFRLADIDINQDAYALSEMLQFIWRSAIRDGKPITIYIPSSRMRRLLKNWIEENSV